MCGVFKGWMFVDRISIIREQCLCMNCLRKGYMAEKCQAPAMCKKCTKHHHLLLHKDADCLPQKKPKEDSKEETHIEALSVSKQVLLGEILPLPEEEKDLIDRATSIKKELKGANYEASRLIRSLDVASKIP